MMERRYTPSKSKTEETSSATKKPMSTMQGAALKDDYASRASAALKTNGKAGVPTMGMGGKQASKPEEAKGPSKAMLGAMGAGGMAAAKKVNGSNYMDEYLRLKKEKEGSTDGFTSTETRVKGSNYQEAYMKRQEELKQAHVKKKSDDAEIAKKKAAEAAIDKIVRERTQIEGWMQKARDIHAQIYTLQHQVAQSHDDTVRIQTAIQDLQGRLSDIPEGYRGG